MNIWHDISPKRITTDKFYAVIEISKGGKNKYEWDKETGLLKLDRVLFTSTHYPANYGFIPRTYADDGDPLDVLVLCSETIQPMTLVECKPIGVLTMIDDEQNKEKIIAVPVNDPNYNGYSDISDYLLIILKKSDTSSKCIRHLKMIRLLLLQKLTVVMMQRKLSESLLTVTFVTSKWHKI